MSVHPRRIAGVLAGGVALGIVTQLLQGLLPGALNWLANSLSGWLVVAFLVGSRLPSARWAAGAGVLLLLAAVAGYYLAIAARYGMGTNPSTLAFWALGALAGGVVFGPAGWAWRHGTERSRPAAIGLLAALLVVEGIYFLAILPDQATGLGAIVAGLAVPLLLGRSGRERGLAYVAILPGLALGAIGYVALGVVSGVVLRG